MYNVHIGLVVFPGAITGSCNEISLVFTKYGLIHTFILGKANTKTNIYWQNFKSRNIENKSWVKSRRKKIVRFEEKKRVNLKIILDFNLWFGSEIKIPNKKRIEIKVLISDGNSDRVAHAWGIKGRFVGKNSYLWNNLRFYLLFGSGIKIPNKKKIEVKVILDGNSDHFAHAYG